MEAEDKDENKWRFTAFHQVVILLALMGFSLYCLKVFGEDMMRTVSGRQLTGG